MHSLIKHLWKHYEPELKRLVERGECDRECELRKKVAQEAYKIRRELIHERLQQPPFLTEERRGWLVRHPVTSENEHILRELAHGTD